MHGVVHRTFHFAAGHTLYKHPGLCRFLHGHNYTVEVFVHGPIDDLGMVIDFGDLKEIVQREVIDPLNHKFMISLKDPRWASLLEIDFDSFMSFDFDPTAENIARWIRTRVEDALIDHARHKSGGPRVAPMVHFVVVHETEDCSAQA